MSRHYIARKDSGALTWMKQFAGSIAADPGKYMVSPAVAADLMGQVGEFEAAYQAAKTPATRTSVAVERKNQLRASAEAYCRLVAQQIKLNAGIGDADKLAIGVRPINRSRTKISVSAEPPALKVTAATPGVHHLQFSEVLLGREGSAKPFGAMQIQVFVAIGDGPARDVNEARYCGAFTRRLFQVGHRHGDDGKMATYWARWLGRRGDVGDWSLPVSMRIVA